MGGRHKLMLKPLIVAVVCFVSVVVPTLGELALDNLRVQGSSHALLDGADWIATHETPGPWSRVCDYQEGIDYNHGEQQEGSAYASNQSECCRLCAERTPVCAAGVFSQNRCWFKSPADIDKPGQFAGAVACKRTRNESGEILTVPNCAVPGDLITDLENGGLIGDPWYEMNFKNDSLWAYGVWNYTKRINFTEEDVKNIAGYTSAGSDVILQFDGIKMGARIYLNGQLLGITTDQFLRYNYSLGQAMRDTGLSVSAGDSNALLVSLDSDINTNGRFMACTGGWDWAPYSMSSGPGYHTFSRGIWRSVYLVTVAAGSVAIEHIVPQIFYTGAYPTEPLVAHEHADFKVDVTVLFNVPRASDGTLQVRGQWGMQTSVTVNVSLPAGSDVRQTVTLTASAKDISLWWPAGLGNQTLYLLNVSFTPKGSNEAVTDGRSIGFRYVALVTGNDTDPGYVKNASTSQTTGQQGMFFRVNGAAVFNRGANMIPMEELEGRMNPVAFSRLVQSAVDGRMNMLRVWGGGIFLPDIWYDECDRLGIMVYHDMMYAQQGHSPVEDSTNENELRYQIRRLAFHPSIIVWDGCNECRVNMRAPTAIYVTFVLRVVAEEDKSRPVWPSCPAAGWQSGVHALDSSPTGAALITPSSHRTIETHGPYLIGSGFITTNSGAKMQIIPSGIPATFRKAITGVDQPNIFASEFGCSVFSSFESMSSNLSPKHWGIHGGMSPENCTRTVCVGKNPMSERNHPCDSVIYPYFNSNDTFNDVGEIAFKKQLYQCMIGQALNMKTTIEMRRSTNQFGIVVWQYNEIWPTGGWGSIEYGTPRPGQVIGGRWKPLHYFYRQSIFTDVTVACGGDGLCYVKNDIAQAFSGTVVISAVAFANAQVTTLESKTLSLATGPGVTEWIQVDFSKINPADQVITATITNADKEVVCNNVIPLTEPYKMKLLQAIVKVSVGSKNPGGSVDIHLTTDHVAMYVTVTTLAAGRFSDNALLLLPAGKTVQFLPFSDTVDMSLLQSSIRVEDISLYM